MLTRLSFIPFDITRLFCWAFDQFLFTILLAGTCVITHRFVGGVHSGSPWIGFYLKRSRFSIIRTLTEHICIRVVKFNFLLFIIIICRVSINHWKFIFWISVDGLSVWRVNFAGLKFQFKFIWCSIDFDTTMAITRATGAFTYALLFIPFFHHLVKASKSSASFQNHRIILPIVNYLCCDKH